MRLVHEQAVNAELLEGDNVVLGAVQQFLELRLKGLLRLFHRLDRKTLAAAALELVYALGYVLYLAPEQTLLALL